MTLSFQKIFYALASVFLLFAVLILGKTILVPLGFALLLACILFPVAKWLEKRGFNRMLAAFTAILTLFVVLGGSIFFFFTQIFNLSTELVDFQDKIMRLFADLLVFVNQNLNLKADLQSEVLLGNIRDWFGKAIFPMAENTLYGTTSFLTALLATIIYTFLLLIYRTGIIQAFVLFGPEKNRKKIHDMLKRIQLVGQKYLSGMVALITILGFANSIGLWIIGIDSPFLFGFLAAVMSIIPYVGTTVGASIPVLYAFMSQDSLWIPLAVAILFWSVQLIESNFLSPKVVGNSLQVNAFAAILSLLIGASVWGVSGMILFLPFAAMLKVFCEEFDDLKPLAMLIGNKIYNGKDDKEPSVTE